MVGLSFSEAEDRGRTSLDLKINPILKVLSFRSLSPVSEGEADVVQMGVRVRVADRVSLGDVLTEIRGVVNVITVRQEGGVQPASGDFKFVNLFVTFEDDEGRDVYGLEKDITAIDGVEAVEIKNYEGRKWSDVRGTYTGGAASKEQK